MGKLYYGSDISPVHVEDELLAHLKVVMTTKLRRRETFTLAWRHDACSPPGRSTLWVAPSISLRFVFDSAEPSTLDPQLIRQMAADVSRTGALTLPTLWTPGARSDELPLVSRPRSRRRSQLAVSAREGQGTSSSRA